jgi:hypothetical protein
MLVPIFCHTCRNRLAVDAISGANTAIGTAMGGYDVEKVVYSPTFVEVVLVFMSALALT